MLFLFLDLNIYSVPL